MLLVIFVSRAQGTQPMEQGYDHAFSLINLRLMEMADRNQSGGDCVR